MEILNTFPSPAKRAMVVVSSLLSYSSADMQMPGIVWLTHWQLHLGLTERLDVAALADGLTTAVLCGLVMSRKKRKEFAGYMQKIGITKLCFVPDNKRLLTEWLRGNGAERQVVMDFVKPAQRMLDRQSRALVIGFDGKDFPNDIRTLPLVRFMWKSREYFFDGFLPKLREIFINPKLDSLEIRALINQLVQGGAKERAISFRTDSMQLTEILRQEYTGQTQPVSVDAPLNTDIVIIGNEFYKEVSGKNFIWWRWSVVKNHWDEIPKTAAKYMVSLDLFRFERMELERIAACRGVKFHTYSSLEELAELCGVDLQKKSSPEPKSVAKGAPANQSQPKQGEIKVAKKVSEAAPTQSDIIRANMGLSNDALVELVQGAYPDAPNKSILTRKYQIAKQLAQAKGDEDLPKKARSKKTKIEPEDKPAASTPEPELEPASVAGANEDELIKAGCDQPAGENVLDALDKAVWYLAEASNLIAGARKEVAEMQTRLQRLEPLEAFVKQMVSAAKQ